MRRILMSADLESLQDRKSTPEQWTAIIPAAGRGTRLGAPVPKAFFPLSGRPLLQWVVDKIESQVAKVVLIGSWSERLRFQDFVRNQNDRHKFHVVYQHLPVGTVDAILRAEGDVKSRYSAVVWGDHYSVRSETVNWTLRAHEARPLAALTLPTCVRENPYISIERDGTGRIVAVKQARDKKIEAPTGENDCGLFAFTTRELFTRLREELRRYYQSDPYGPELNLLSLLPAFEGEEGLVQTLQIAELSETHGLNTPEEAQWAEVFLKEKRWHPIG